MTLHRSKWTWLGLVGLLLLLLLWFGWNVLRFPSQSAIQSVAPWICPNATYAFELNDPQQRLVALTIDDAPDDRSASDPNGASNTTQEILRVLEDYNAHATFFLISRYVQNREQQLPPDQASDPVVRQIIQDGHEMGNHLTEDARSINLGAGFEADLLEADRVLRPYTQLPGSQYPELRWTRPGSGFCTPQMVETAQKHGYQTVLGTLWPYDTVPLIASSAFSTDFILSNIAPGKIIILHDAGKQGDRGYRTVAALEQILKALQQDPYSYKVVTLSELLQAGTVSPTSPALPPLLETIRVKTLRFLISAPTPQQWLQSLGLFGVFSVVMLFLAYRSHFIRWELAQPPEGTNPLWYFVSQGLLRFIVPSAIEEIVMRGLLLPSPAEISGSLSFQQLGLVVLSLGLYVAYHPPVGSLIDRIRRRQDHPSSYGKTFRKPIFLGLAALLGMACTLSFVSLGSIYPPILFHGLVVAVWILFLGGQRRLSLNTSLERETMG